MEILKINNITSGYESTDILSEISFEVNYGEILLVVGANGAGKSTLLKSIIGLLKIKRGEIYFQKKSLFNLQPFQRVQIGISYVFQDRKVFPNNSVEDNLILANFRDKNNLNKNLNEIFSNFPILYKKRKELSCNLSGGEQQILVYARALIQKPKLILLDEPFTGLSISIKSSIINSIKSLSKKGVSFIIVEHQIEDILTISNKVLGLKNGKIVFFKNNKEFSNKKNIYNSLNSLI